MFKSRYLYLVAVVGIFGTALAGRPESKAPTVVRDSLGQEWVTNDGAVHVC